MAKHWKSLFIKKSTTILFMTLLLPASTIAQQTSSTKLTENNELLRKAELKAAQTFFVSSGEKTTEHPFYAQGNKMGFAVDSIFGKELVLTRGATYIFDVDTNVKHDFYFSTHAKGWGASAITEGVIGQFIYKGKVAFSPNELLPERIFYACRNHKYMGGLIHIINKGETVVLEGSNLNSAIQNASASISENDIKQKIAIARIMTTGEAAQRVESSSDSSAKGLLNKAKTDISAAETSLKAGNNGKSLKAVTTALDNVKAAIDMVPLESSMIDQRAKYSELVDNYKIYRDSYAQQYALAKINGDIKFDAQINPKTLQKMDDDAVVLSKNGKYAEANRILSQALEMVIIALTSVFEGQQVVYDKSFATAVEEFEYELARNKGFEDLIPIAIAQKRPSAGAIKLMDSYVAKSKKIAAEAKDFAAKGDHATAVLGLQESTRQIQRALVSAGVR